MSTQARTSTLTPAVAQAIKRAEAQFRAEQLPQAELSCRMATSLDPENFEALCLLGVIVARSGRLPEAEDFLKRATQARPDDPECQFNYGNLLRLRGRTAEATSAFRRALEIKPSFAEAAINLGNLQRDLGNMATALDCFDQAIRASQRFPEAYTGRAAVLLECGRAAQALEDSNAALALRADFATALNLRGAALQALKQFTQALGAYQQATQAQPDLIDAWNNCGNMLLYLKRPEDAARCFKKALSQRSDFVAAWNGLAQALCDMGRTAEALAACNRALQARPDCSDALLTRGNILHRQMRAEHAVTSYEAAIALNPCSVEAHRKLGDVLLELRRFDRALDCFDKAVALDPSLPWLSGNQLFLKLQVCDWADLAELQARVERQIVEAAQASQPFATLAWSNSAQLQRRAAESWAKDQAPPAASVTSPARRPGRPVLRVGYFSGDYHNHATTYLAAELFEQHDRSRFRVFGFSFGPPADDEMRNRTRAGFDEFIDVGGMSDRDVAMLSRQMEIDIAVDLKGFTQHSRPGIFAHRAAPLQVSYLGYPGTLGAPFMDYLVADRVLVPEDHRIHYSEKIVYLPHSYQINDRRRPLPSNAEERGLHGLPSTGIVYCCFNNAFKISPELFALWMRLLNQTPGSVLWLLSDGARADQNLRRAAELHHVDSQRLVFAGRVSLDRHLSRHHCADLFLDTLPYNAHTTASDALWMGLPLITRLGETFAGRVAASLLTAVDLGDLITSSADEYERLALDLAANPARLQQYREHLRAQRNHCALFDSARFTRNLERAFSNMQARQLAGQPPEHLFIEADVL